MLRSSAFPVRAVVGCALIAAAVPASAQVFKCVDPGGHVTYQQAPCPVAHKGGPLELFLDNGSGKDTPDVEARWKAIAEAHDVAAGMPKRWVQISLGAPAGVTQGTPADAASEIWTYPTGTSVMRVGFVGGVVAWSRSDSTLGTGTTGMTTADADAARSRVAADRNCDEVLGELGNPTSQEPTRVTVGTGGTLRSADGMRYSFEPIPGGLPARLSFVCVDSRVVSVARDVPR
jgi:hypothetical protein